MTNGDMIIGNQPALDVDAIIRQQQVQTGFVYSTHVLSTRSSRAGSGARGRMAGVQGLRTGRAHQ